MAVGSQENGIGERVAQASGDPAGAVALVAQVLCPYCGHRQGASDQCESCHGLLDPLSRQATQNQMGPWFVRNERNPFAPGMSHERIRQMALRGRLRRDSVVRGPSTRQFWTLACKTPGIACLLGECHNCHGGVEPDGYMCPSCGVVLSWSSERQHLGLSPIKLLPGEAPPAEVASSGMGGGESRPAAPVARQAPEASERQAPAVKAEARPERRRGGRRRRQNIAQRNALIAVTAFSVFVVASSLIAVFGFGIGVETAGEAPGTTAAAPSQVEQRQQAPETVAPAPIAPALVVTSEMETGWISPAAATALDAFADELAVARKLSESGDAGALERAAALGKDIRARAASAGVSQEALAELDAWIKSVGARADELRLRAFVSEGAGG